MLCSVPAFSSNILTQIFECFVTHSDFISLLCLVAQRKGIVITMKPKFSIIVPIYKVEQYLEKCVLSLVNQTYENIEIILVDDGSPDNCPKMCDDFGGTDSRIVVLHKPNGGLSDARNKGLEVAQGEYIMFVDSDDYIAPNACEQFAEFVDKGYDILIGDAEIEGGSANIAHIEKTEKIYTGEDYLLAALEENKLPMAAWLNVYRKVFLDKYALRFKYGRLHEDEEFTPRAFLKAERIFNTGIVFYHYIIRENSITTQKDKRKNAESLFQTCIELQTIYSLIDNVKLKKLLCDSLVAKYLGMIQTGNLAQYGNKYLHRGFLLRNAKRLKTKFKTFIFALSPKLYCYVYNKKLE